MSHPLVSTALLTLIFGGLYMGLRHLPTTVCGILHYEVTEVLADGSEVCDANHNGYIDLTQMRFPVQAQLTADTPLEPGAEAWFTLDLKGAGGRPLLPHELAITHTERLHVMVVDPSLQTYFHVHPEPLGPTGKYTFAVTPDRPGTYEVFVEMVPVASKRVAVAQAAFEVPGQASDPVFAGNLSAQVGPYEFRLVKPRDPLPRSADHQMQLIIEHTEGGTVEPQKLMGDVAHMVAFDEGRNGYAHMHPLPELRESAPAREAMGFLFNTARPGNYRLWAQLKLDGQEMFVPFDARVQ